MSSHATSVAGSAPSSSPRFAVAGAIGGAVLGLVLLVAALLKALDPAAFAEEISGQGVAFGLTPTIAAWIALGIEVALGTALLFNLRRRAVLIAATLLVAFFVFLTARGAWRAARGESDPGSSCGCFGALVERTPNQALVQDIALLVPALALAWVGRPGARRAVAARWTAVTAATAGLLGLAIAAPGLALDDYVTRLKPGAELAGLCAGAGDARVCLSDLAPALAEGRHLVIIADTGAESFASLAARLNAAVRRGDEPPVAVLADLTPEARTALYWSVAPAFDLHETPQALLRPLYRRLPRSFLVEEGRVTTTWAGLPPALNEDSPTDSRSTTSGDSE